MSRSGSFLSKMPLPWVFSIASSVGVPIAGGRDPPAGSISIWAVDDPGNTMLIRLHARAQARSA